MKKISLLLVIILIASCLGCALPGIAFAASETIYTGVIEDLSKDETFNAAQFPAGSEDKMDLIQVAESNAGELFLYVYSPTGDKFTASEVRISQTIGDNVDPKDYTLTMLSRDGTLAKYKVNGLQVKADAVRYYLVIQIARHWDKNVDKDTSGDNTANTIPYEVGKRFTACTDQDGFVTYIEEHDEVVTITDKWFGYLRYSNGFKLYNDSCDAWFIAFNTDKPIDYLYDADVEFYSQRFSYNFQYMIGWQVNENFTDKEPQGPYIAKLSDKDTAETKADGLFAYKYKWNRIESVDDFKKNETLSEKYLTNLDNKTWILRFTETDFGYFQSTYTGTQNYTVISEVSVLRLHFRSNGKIYNLGVVDNKISDPSGPVNDDVEAIDGALKKVRKIFEDIANWFESAGRWIKANWWVIIVGLVAIGLIVSLIVFIVRKGAAVVFKVIGKVLLFILKWIIFLPITLIVYGIRAAKKNK